MQYWWMPKGTPPDRIEVFANALEQALNTDLVRDWLANVQSDPVFAKGEALQRRTDRLESQVSTVNLQEPVDMPNLPAIVLVSVVVFGLAVGARALRSRHSFANVTSPAPTARYGLAVGCGLLVIAYALVLGWDVDGWSIGFWPVTLVFVAAIGLLLAPDRRRATGWVIGLALLLAIGLQYLLTQVFVIDLP